MKIGIIIIILAVIVGAWFYFNKTASPAPVSNPAPQNTAQETNHSVAIEGFAFGPKSLNIKKGETIVWANNDSVPHTVTSDTGTTLASQTLNKGGNYSFTFNSAGTFSYHCAFHPSMKGTIVVE